MVKRKDDPLDATKFWAQSVFRTQIAGKGKICALIRKRYSEMDVEKKGPSQWLGIEEYEEKDLITDADPESETFGKRIPDPNSEGGTMKMRFVLDDDKETVDKIRKMSGTTNYGSTILTYKFRERTIDAPNYEEYWTKPIMQAYKELITDGGKVVVSLEQSKKK